eukprot:GEMP01006973.1.p1 GENE.GEMP01006973.1~~GEMP01006973.1.p1  ORF type:complete len:638 (+),score=128.01 GEMP01006973.1:245-2158(+)
MDKSKTAKFKPPVRGGVKTRAATIRQINRQDNKNDILESYASHLKTLAVENTENRKRFTVKSLGIGSSSPNIKNSAPNPIGNCGMCRNHAGTFIISKVNCVTCYGPKTCLRAPEFPHPSVAAESPPSRAKKKVGKKIAGRAALQPAAPKKKLIKKTIAPLSGIKSGALAAPTPSSGIAVPKKMQTAVQSFAPKAQPVVASKKKLVKRTMAGVTAGAQRGKLGGTTTKKTPLKNGALYKPADVKPARKTDGSASPMNFAFDVSDDEGVSPTFQAPIISTAATMISSSGDGSIRWETTERRDDGRLARSVTRRDKNGEYGGDTSEDDEDSHVGATTLLSTVKRVQTISVKPLNMLNSETPLDAPRRLDLTDDSTFDSNVASSSYSGSTNGKIRAAPIRVTPIPDATATTGHLTAEVMAKSNAMHLATLANSRAANQNGAINSYELRPVQPSIGGSIAAASSMARSQAASSPAARSVARSAATSSHAASSAALSSAASSMAQSLAGSSVARSAAASSPAASPMAGSITADSPAASSMSRSAAASSLAASSAALSSSAGSMAQSLAASSPAASDAVLPVSPTGTASFSLASGSPQSSLQSPIPPNSAHSSLRQHASSNSGEENSYMTASEQSHGDASQTSN